MDFRTVLVGSIAYVYQYRINLAKSLLIPCIFLFILDVVLTLQWSPGFRLAVGLLGIPLQTLVAVNTHRTILLGANSIPEWGLQWSRRETLFALYLAAPPLLISLLRLLDLFTYGSIGLLAFPALWVVSRISLVFPAIAVNRQTSLRDSWRLTEKHQTLMVKAVFLVPMALAFPVIFLNMLPGTLLFLDSILSIGLTVFVVAALSLSYQTIVKADD